MPAIPSNPHSRIKTTPLNITGSDSLKRSDDFFTAGLGQMIRKETSIAYDNPEGHRSFFG